MADLDISAGRLYEGEPPSPSEAVGKAAFYLQRDVRVLPTAVKAKLRRLDPTAPIGPAVHKMLHALGQAESEDWISQSLWEKRWGLTLHSAALCGEHHDYDVSLGHALRQSGVSESRLISLLEAKSRRLFQLSAHVSRRLSRAGVPANLDRMRLLLFYQSGETGDGIRTDISRSFFRSRSQEEQKQNEQEQNEREQNETTSKQ